VTRDIKRLLCRKMPGTQANKVLRERVSPPSAASLTVEVAADANDLLARLPAWEKLCKDPLERNIFLEPWQFLPAVKAFGESKTSLFLFVYRKPPTTLPDRELIGFFPFEQKRQLRGLPARIISAWEHPHSFLSTPLLHTEYATQAWSTLIDWAQRHPQVSTLLRFPLLLTEGPSHAALLEVLHRDACIHLAVEHYARAVLQHKKPPNGGCDRSAAFPTDTNKELRRQRRRLGELGRIEFRTLRLDDDPLPWIEQFLVLEASGWKGVAESAIGSRRNETQYFRTICREGHRRKQLHVMGLFLDGKPIAMKLNFETGKVGYAVKICYDETYKDYSPGIQLELEYLTYFQTQSGLTLVDSCAVPDHPMINRLWKGRRAIADFVISPRRTKGNLQLAAYMALRSLKRSMGRSRSRREPEINDSRS
jgi:CelD/BcsL family acetyltransferase involved in cellulose biosynthesis